MIGKPSLNSSAKRRRDFNDSGRQVGRQAWWQAGTAGIAILVTFTVVMKNDFLVVGAWRLRGWHEGHGS